MAPMSSANSIPAKGRSELKNKLEKSNRFTRTAFSSLRGVIGYTPVDEAFINDVNIYTLKMLE